MVTAKEPESNIARVIKHYNQINTSPLKNTEENGCDDGWVKNEAGECVPEEKVEPQYGSSVDENVWTQNRGVSSAEKAAMEQYEKEQKLKKEKEAQEKLAQEQKDMEAYVDGSDQFKEGFTPAVEGVEVIAQKEEAPVTESNGAIDVFNKVDEDLDNQTKDWSAFMSEKVIQKPLDAIDKANAYKVGEGENTEEAYLYWLNRSLLADPVTSNFAQDIINGSTETLEAEKVRLQENYNINIERNQKIFEYKIAQNSDVYNK